MCWRGHGALIGLLGGPPPPGAGEGPGNGPWGSGGAGLGVSLTPPRPPLSPQGGCQHQCDGQAAPDAADGGGGQQPRGGGAVHGAAGRLRLQQGGSWHHTPSLLTSSPPFADVIAHTPQEEDGSTCLHHAAKNGNLEMVDLLLSTGQVDVNAQVGPWCLGGLRGDPGVRVTLTPLALPFPGQRGLDPHHLGGRAQAHRGHSTAADAWRRCHSHRQRESSPGSGFQAPPPPAFEALLGLFQDLLVTTEGGFEAPQGDFKAPPLSKSFLMVVLESPSLLGVVSRPPWSFLGWFQDPPIPFGAVLSSPHPYQRWFRGPPPG